MRSSESTFEQSGTRPGESGFITLFLCGDVMTGRGIDQIMPSRSRPEIYEPYVRDARMYVELAEAANGPVPRPVDYEYIWGDALRELDRVNPDARIINLETSITESEHYWRGKGINYRMHPVNVPCLTAARIDVCCLANNHTLDWGYTGLSETLEVLQKHHIKTAGAGRNLAEAEAASIIDLPGKGRILVSAFGSETSGIPRSWAAAQARPGLNFIRDFSETTAAYLREKVQGVKKERDIAVASLHWGVNWDYRILPEEREFAHRLIDVSGFDVVHGHSSHHVKGIEVYREKLILYGCGDFLSDYEGIKGYRTFRGDLGLMYFPVILPSTGSLVQLEMVPIRVRNLRVNRATRAEARWLFDTLRREGKQLGTQVNIGPENMLSLVLGDSNPESRLSD
jgi:poly-gamma-glutamate capsule biosynthesis protein CapA/YwtB (metallophosphatase superfamily)